MPRPGWAPFVAAVFTAAFFLLLTVQARACPPRRAASIAIGAILHWALGSSIRAPLAAPVDIGGGIARARVPERAALARRGGRWSC